MRRPTAGDQRGMTLVETILALGLSVMLVLPMMGWAQLAMHQQVAVRERNISGASLGILRTHFLRDVANSHRAVVDGDDLRDCDADTGYDGTGSGGTPLLALSRGDERIVYSVAPSEDSAASLWRRVCDAENRGTVGATPLVDEVDPKVTGASCEPRDPAPPSESRPCHRVELRVTTPQLDQVVLSATVRSDGELDELPPSVVAGADPLVGPAPLRVQFTSTGSVDPGGGELVFHWDFGDGSTSSEANPTHTYVQPGSYTTVLTATNELGGSGEATIEITATNRPPIAVIAAPANDAAAFRGELVQFSSKGSNDDADAARSGHITAWAWDFGDGTTSNAPEPVKAYDRLRPEGYVVTLTVTDSDGTTASATSLLRIVNRAPTVQIVADRTSGASPLSVDLAAVVVDELTMASNPPLTYAWDLGNGTTSTSADPPAVTYTGAGSRTVRGRSPTTPARRRPPPR